MGQLETGGGGAKIDLPYNSPISSSNHSASVPHMATHSKNRGLLLHTFVLLLTSNSLHAQKQQDWTWKDPSGQTRSVSDLAAILKSHERWVKSAHKSGGQANLIGADLSSLDLDPHGASPTGVDLSGAELYGVNLNGAHLYLVNLSEADLGIATLVNADLTSTNMRGADLSQADLSGAGLTDTNLTGADFTEADVTRTLFEPKTLPDLRSLASAISLESLTYNKNPDALFQLRKQLADAGFRDQERKITYALKRRESEISRKSCTTRQSAGGTRSILWSSDSSLANCGSFLLNRIFFDLTCQYGMSPGRPLSLGVALWLVCSLLYFVCIHAVGKTRLYRIYAPAPSEILSAERREEILPPKLTSHGFRRFLEFLHREWLVCRTSMFFSLMAAFNIGFREINFGRWLRSLTRQEFDIKAVGWARVIAGWQSLLSVYFLALWVLSYFGRPFG